MYKYRFNLLLGLLGLVHFHDLDTKELAEHLSISKSTCKRIIKCLREQCYVQINWEKYEAGSQGAYSITDWGVFNKKFVTDWAKKNSYN